MASTRPGTEQLLCLLWLLWVVVEVEVVGEVVVVVQMVVVVVDGGGGGGIRGGSGLSYGRGCGTDTSTTIDL